MEGIRAYPFADSLVLARTAGEPLLLLNPTGRIIWEGRNQGLAPHAIARRLAHEFGIPEAVAHADLVAAEAAWKAGLVDGTRTIPGAPDSAATGTTPRTFFFPLPRRRSRRVYALCGQPIAVLFAQRDLEALVHPQFAYSEAPRAEAIASITLARTRAGYSLLTNGVEGKDVPSAEALLGEFVKRFVELSYPSAGWLAVMHAAAVADERGVIILPGTNGRGKSTLTAALAAEGYAYLSDDCVPLERGGQVVPVPFGICLKEEGWHVVNPYLPQLRTAPTYDGGDGRRRRYVPPPVVARAWSAPRALVFPEYVKGATTLLRPLGPVEALGLLLDGRTWLSREPDDLRAALALLERLPAYRLVHSSLAEATAIIRSLPDAPSPPV